LTSGTLKPMESYEKEIGLQFKYKLENSHVINKEQVQVNILGRRMDGTPFKFNFENRQNEDMVREAGKSLNRISQFTPGGVLVFFPSYGLMKDYVKEWKRAGII